MYLHFFIFSSIGCQKLSSSSISNRGYAPRDIYRHLMWKVDPIPHFKFQFEKIERGDTLNLSGTYSKLFCKEEQYLFSSQQYQYSFVQTERQTHRHSVTFYFALVGNSLGRFFPLAQLKVIRTDFEKAQQLYKRYQKVCTSI